MKEVPVDYTKQGPWNTTLYIGSRSEGKKPFLKVTITEHGNTFGAEWINEKLLFIRVWWGRIVSSDLLLNVEQGSLLYAEDANYSQLVSHCRN
jgi:hypothetical protein